MTATPPSKGAPAPQAPLPLNPSREPGWVILHFASDSERSEPDLIRAQDVEPAGPWDDDHPPHEICQWVSQKAAERWAHAHLPRLYPGRLYLAFDFGSAPIFATPLRT